MVQRLPCPSTLHFQQAGGTYTEHGTPRLADGRRAPQVFFGEVLEYQQPDLVGEMPHFQSHDSRKPTRTLAHAHNQQTHKKKNELRGAELASACLTTHETPPKIDAADARSEELLSSGRRREGDEARLSDAWVVPG